jgi:single stranded DNA-binding protein
MMTSLNKLIICGKVTDAGPKLTYTSEGTPQCSFTLMVEEPGRDGSPFKLFVPVELFGKQAEPVAEQVNAGDVVLVDGKLRWRSWIDKKGEKQGRLGVMAWAVNVLQGAAVSAN